MKKNNLKKGDLCKIIYTGLIYPSIANTISVRGIFNNNFILKNSLIKHCDYYKNNYGIILEIIVFNLRNIYILFVPQQRQYCFIAEDGVSCVC